MIKSRAIQSAAEILVAVAEDREDPDEALRRWRFPIDVGDADVAHGWHLLDHYATDSDIRAKEEDYENARKEELIQCARKLMQKARSGHD